MVIRPDKITHALAGYGITLLGLLAALFFYHWIGAFGVVFSLFAGGVTYANDVYYKNDPSKLDPVFSTIGGLIFLGFMYARAHL